MIGETLQGCRIEEKLCTTTTGNIYRSKELLLGVPRAIKVIHPQLTLNTVIRERFKRAVQSWAKLDHPTFIHIFAAVETEQTLAAVMDFIEGESLAHFLKGHGKLGISQACDYFLQVGRAVAFAHEHHILHRKLSPDNIIIRKDESIRVGGLNALRELQPPKVTPPQLCIGKPKYMAPEQFGGNYSELTDEYALGAIFYEMLAGRPPFVADNLRVLYRMHFQQKPASLSAINPEITHELEDIVFKALAKKPEARFPNVKALIEAVLTATDQMEVSHDTNIQSLMYKGRHALERRKLEQAIYFFNRVIGLYVGEESPLLQEARDKRAEAIYMYEEEANIRKMRELLGMSLDCFDNEDLEGARTNVFQILQMMRAYPDSSRVRGIRMDIMKELPDILAEMSNKLESNIEEGKKLAEKASRYLENGQYEDCLLMAAEALRHDPANEEAVALQKQSQRQSKMALVIQCYRDGHQAFKNSQYSQATSFFEKVLELAPEYPSAGKYLKIAQEKEAEEKLRRAEVEKTYREGLALYEKWQYQEALEKFEKVLSLDNKHEDSNRFINAVRERLSEDNRIEEISFFYQKGVNFYQERKWREAISCFNRVLREMSTHKKALEYKKLAEIALAEEDRQHDLLEQAMVYFRESQYEKALEGFDYLAQLAQTNPEIQKYRNLCIEFIRQNTATVMKSQQSSGSKPKKIR